MYHMVHGRMGFDPSPYKTVALGRDRCNSVSLLLMWIQWHFLKVSNFGISEIVTRWFFGHQGTPQKIEPLSSGCIRHPCWLMIGSRVVQPHILAMIRMRGFMDSLFTNKWHFRIWALWNMLLTSPSRPFASICTAGGDDDNDFMRRGRFRDNRWVLRPEYLAGRGVWDSCGATLHNGATVETAQFRANLGEKGEPSGFTNFNAFDWH